MADILQTARECGALDAGTSQLGERVFLAGENALAAFAARIRAEAMEEAANIADDHECGGPDDISCQGQNCGMIIAAAIRRAGDAIRRNQRGIRV